jgi:glycosyltransferase involved in cell wall biosynthesis
MSRSPSVADLRISTTAGQRPSVVYFGLYDRNEAPGVHQKITGVLAAARDAGFVTRAWAEPFSQPAVGRMAAAIVASTETHIIVRSQGWANMFLWGALRGVRRRGQHVIVDVPTPHYVGVREVWRSRDTAWRRLRAVIAFYVSGPWSLWPASRIVQYAPENWWFGLGNAARTVEIGNGIDVAAVVPRRGAPPWPSPTLHVLTVASVARWHGLDRLLRAVRAYQDRSPRAFDIHVTIAGDGPALPRLRETAESLQLLPLVTFAGTVTGPRLQELYESAHVAVSSLGLHRIGLSRASVLKAREYCAVGIPFIASGQDPDFPSATPFRLTVSGNETIHELVELFVRFDSVYARFDDAAERAFARSHLDWRSKIGAFGLQP